MIKLADIQHECLRLYSLEKREIRKLDPQVPAILFEDFLNYMAIQTRLYSQKYNLFCDSVMMWTEDKHKAGVHYSSGLIGYWFGVILYNEEYIHETILHELCHSVHGNHLADFWNMLTGLLKAESMLIGEHYFESHREETGDYVLIENGTTEYWVGKNKLRMYKMPILTKRNNLISDVEWEKFDLIKTIINRTIKKRTTKHFISFVLN